MTIIRELLKKAGLSEEDIDNLNDPAHPGISDQDLPELDSSSGYQIGSQSTGNPSGVEITPA